MTHFAFEGHASYFICHSAAYEGCSVASAFVKGNVYWFRNRGNKSALWHIVLYILVFVGAMVLPET